MMMMIYIILNIPNKDNIFKAIFYPTHQTSVVDKSINLSRQHTIISNGHGAGYPELVVATERVTQN